MIKGNRATADQAVLVNVWEDPLVGSLLSILREPILNMDGLPLKQLGKSLLLTYAICGAAWLWNETSPLGWWTLKPRTKEEKKLAHLYERREFPYPGDEEAVREFIKKGGFIGTTIGPKGFVDKSGSNPQKQLQEEKFERESKKLWLRMRNEVIEEIQDQGYEIE